MGSKKVKKQSEAEMLEEIKKEEAEVKAAEVEEKKDEKKVAKLGKQKKRSAKYKAALAKVDRAKFYTLDEAIKLAKDASYSKFDGAIEAHLKLAIAKGKKGKPMEFRGMISFPHASGKKLNVVELTEAKIEEIEKTKKIDFDLCVIKPSLMPKAAKIAKILGPKGKMPSPKSGTITEDVEKAIKELSSGKTEIKSDPNGNIHLTLGKVSWGEDKIIANWQTAIASIPMTKITQIFLTATMGPGIKVKM